MDGSRFSGLAPRTENRGLTHLFCFLRGQMREAHPLSRPSPENTGRQNWNRPIPVCAGGNFALHPQQQLNPFITYEISTSCGAVSGLNHRAGVIGTGCHSATGTSPAPVCRPARARLPHSTDPGFAAKPRKNRCRSHSRRLLTRAALIWWGLQSRDRKGAVDTTDSFSPSALTRGYSLAALRACRCAPRPGRQ